MCWVPWISQAFREVNSSKFGFRFMLDKYEHHPGHGYVNDSLVGCSSTPRLAFAQPKHPANLCLVKRLHYPASKKSAQSMLAAMWDYCGLLSAGSLGVRNFALQFTFMKCGCFFLKTLCMTLTGPSQGQTYFASKSFNISKTSDIQWT